MKNRAKMYVFALFFYLKLSFDHYILNKGLITCF